MPEQDAKAATDAPAKPPGAPKTWWAEMKWQSRIGLFGMVVQIPALAYFGLDDAATMPVVVVNLGLVATVLHYGGGSAAIDLVRAWRGE